jgi:hypothetical protein
MVPSDEDDWRSSATIHAMKWIRISISVMFDIPDGKGRTFQVMAVAWQGRVDRGSGERADDRPSLTGVSAAE